jgi:hypothetical protein
MPRRSEGIDQSVWIDDDGPVAAVVLTDWGRAWGCDPIVVPAASTVPLSTVWARAVEAIDALELRAVEVLVRDDDAELSALLFESGFVADTEQSGITWIKAEELPKVAALPPGFALDDRAHQASAAHPMRRRNGDHVEDRLRQCSLYDPALDLAVVTAHGQVAGYALFWFDPVTRVGLDEPMRVEDAYQRLGLARALLTAGPRSAGGERRVPSEWATAATRRASSMSVPASG